MSSIVRHGLAAAAFALAAAVPARAQDSTFQRAMRDELDRSIRDLRLGQLERPYFIAYRAFDARLLRASATHGDLLSSGTHHGRNIEPEVRVGDYAFDNTNFMNFGGGGLAISFGGGGGDITEFGPAGLPLDDNYLELRRQIWLMTDAAYKSAAESFAEKRAGLLNRARRDTLPDFARATPTETVDTGATIDIDRAQAESLVRALSGIPEFARLDRSEVFISIDNSDQYLLNTEGTTAFVRRGQVALTATAATQAPDGTRIAASIHAYGRSARDLPARDQLSREVRELALRLDSLRRAPVLEHYSGPVLFEGRAAAELFAQRFVPALAGVRAPDGGPDIAAMMQAAGGGMTSFMNRVRSRVLPSSMTVVDDPTQTAQEGVALLGSYRVDDDGVPARRKVLIANGIVKQILTTRVPVRGFLESTGNRRGEGVAPSNIIVTATNGSTDAELRARLLGLVKDRGLDYGVIVRELGGAAIDREDPRAMMAEMSGRAAGRPVLLAYRVYPDGREELVRGARLLDVSAESFKDIVAVSSRSTVLHQPAIGLGGFAFGAPMEMLEALGEESGVAFAFASYVVPSLLFEDLSLERAAGELLRPPLSPPPGNQ